MVQPVEITIEPGIETNATIEDLLDVCTSLIQDCKHVFCNLKLYSVSDFDHTVGYHENSGYKYNVLADRKPLFNLDLEPDNNGEDRYIFNLKVATQTHRFTIFNGNYHIYNGNGEYGDVINNDKVCAFKNSLSKKVSALQKAKSEATKIAMARNADEETKKAIATVAVLDEKTNSFLGALRDIVRVKG